LQAFALCRGRAELKDLRFRVAGVAERYHAVFRAEADRLGIGAAVDFENYLSEDAMRRLYAGASLFLMPSLAEGFGIPVLEAMATGVPVASSNAGSLPEVGGEAARYFDPASVEAMADAMSDVLVNAGLRRATIEAGRIQARSFHPDSVRARIDALWAEIESLAQPEAAQ
ncbi:MAG: glycosyltransferase, partial [Terracidiphilus sp.]